MKKKFKFSILHVNSLNFYYFHIKEDHYLKKNYKQKICHIFEMRKYFQELINH